jgi:alkanesulfonate monooxygenase SsuD/methylene tetrahydromethanopterin reductase-like flavin-dependent oxidoreductase (luciferase family)
MRHGFVLPGGPAHEQLAQAAAARRRGGTASSSGKGRTGSTPGPLPAAMAVRTEQIRLGTLTTPLPWRRASKVASQVAMVDQLSGGRAILAAGVGAVGPEMPPTGEELGLRRRAEQLDEGIDLVRELWRGGGSCHGRHDRDEPGGSQSS